MVWRILKGALNWEKITTGEQAVEKLQEAWNNLPQETCDALCRSFPGRLAMVIEAKGKTIQPLLSSHKTSVPTGYIAHARIADFRPFAREEDELLREVMKRPGAKKWDEISQ
jgi:hypothetical protein